MKFSSSLGISMTLAAAAVSCWHEKMPWPRAPKPELATPPAPSVRVATPPASAMPTATSPAANPGPAERTDEWLEAPLESGCAAADECELPSFGTPGDDLRVLAVGGRTVVLATRLGLVTLDSDYGISGPFSLPGNPDPRTVHHVGVGTFEQLIYADPNGRVWTMRLGADAFEARGHVPGAVAWDFAHGILSAVAGDTVWVSEDGDYFRRIDFPTPRQFKDVFVRDDGTLVVRGDYGIELSHDRGWNWTRSDLEGSTITREGQWISLCAEATLSADGRTWVKTPARLFDPSRWFATFELARRPTGFIEGSFDMRSLQTAPATNARGALRGSFGCSAHLPRFGVISAPAKPPTPLVSVPRGLETVAAWPVAPRVPATRTAFAFLANGVCERRPANRGRSTCPLGAPFTRAPLIAAIDRETSHVHLRGVPDNCEPQEIADASGAAILICGSPPQNRTVWLLSRAQDSSHHGAPQIEDQVPLRIGQSRDGSIAVLTDISPLTVAVRGPGPVDAPNAWRRILVDDAVAYRVANAGAIVAVTASSSEVGKFSLVLVSPTGTETELAEALPLGEGIEAVDVDGTEVVVRRRSSGGPVEERIAVRW